MASRGSNERAKFAIRTVSPVFNMEGAVVPSTWSQIATDIIAQKYFRKAGVPADKAGAWEAYVPGSKRAVASQEGAGESDARQVFHRLAFTWTEWGKKAGYFDTEEDSSAFYDEILHMLARQMAAPNSPQWFNTGLHAVYGIEGPAQGHYYVDPATGDVTKSASAYERPQPHACFILNIEDDLVNEGGIMDLVTREARLFKYGSGTGSNFSKIRGLRESLSGGGVSSGLLSFLKIADRSASAIKSGGTTRRAAKMVILDADHPDIESYTNWKAEEEYKVACLAAGSGLIRARAAVLAEAVRSFAPKGAPEGEVSDEARFSFKLNPALRSEAKSALRAGIPAPFLHQLLSMFRQGDYSSADGSQEVRYGLGGGGLQLRLRPVLEQFGAIEQRASCARCRRTATGSSTARTTGKVMKKLKARALWDGDRPRRMEMRGPGPPIPRDRQRVAHLPGRRGDPRLQPLLGVHVPGRYRLQPRLAQPPRPSMTKGTRRFDDEAYRHAVRLWTTVLEISVVMAQFPSKEIARKSYDYRTLGLGYANLGSLLMVMGFAYDSPEGRAVAAALSAILTGEAYAQSARMAEAWGPFARYEANREHMLRVIRNHRRAAYGAPASEYEGLTVTPAGLDASACPANLVAAARDSWDQALAVGERSGYRNAQVSAMAPTGTIGLLMDCDTTGVEPDFALVKFKKLAGGGYFKIINQCVPPALRALGYSEAAIGEIEAYALGHGTLKGAPGSLSLDALAAKGLSKPLSR